jgi:hypothetical protein
METQSSSQKKLSHFRKGGIGFLIGAFVFAIFSMIAPFAQKAVSPSLCALAPGQHFPPGSCMLFTGLVGALWMGPASLLALIPNVQRVIPYLLWPSMLWIRILSAIMVGLLAMAFFVRSGIRRGAIIFLLVSVGLIAAFTIFFTMFAVSY